MEYGLTGAPRTPEPGGGDEPRLQRAGRCAGASSVTWMHRELPAQPPPVCTLLGVLGPRSPHLETGSLCRPGWMVETLETKGHRESLSEVPTREPTTRRRAP